jgi:pyruvate/2-oxoacid:ferredoxin oxidoreductase beta subunit
MEPAYSIRISRLAVKSKVFPLYEVENGEKWNITVLARPQTIQGLPLRANRPRPF